ncbi:hypothetical protein MUP29_08795 [bacterium]|nr:hypothetical protein [bacterium]
MKKEKGKLVRGTLVLVALALIATGLRSFFLNSDLFYSNWWGGLVFAPFTLVVGVLFLYLLIFKWDKFKEAINTGVHDKEY